MEFPAPAAIVSTILSDTAPAPVITHAQLHPAWCDSRTCTIDPQFGEDSTLYAHSFVLLCEPMPGQAAFDEHGYDRRIRVQVERYDLRRNADGVVLGDNGAPGELDPVTVYVYGLDQANLDSGLARRVAEALAEAAAIVSKVEQSAVNA